MKRERLKKLSSLFLLPFLFSCRNTSLSPCYQCYMGKMYLSDATKRYDSIKSMTIQDDITKGNGAFYGDGYILKTLKEINLFAERDDIEIQETEIEKIKTKIDDEIIEYFFVQIPSGYKAEKRYNVQGYIKKDEGQTLLTDNFFYYEPKKEELYCLIDIKKDEAVTSSYVFSFYFSIPKELSDILDGGTTHLIYHDADKTEETQAV